MNRMGTQLHNEVSAEAPIAELCELLRETYGKDISGYDVAFLARSLAKRVAGTGAMSASDYLRRLVEDRSEADGFFDFLNITYSDFFRSPLTFGHLEQLLLPNLFLEVARAGRAELRVWVAGCAAGQEAWSVAMLLEDLAAARGHSLPFRIIATDISEAGLALARAGTYDQRAMQNVRLRHLREYFLKKGETYTVGPLLRSHVEFSRYDLLDERSICPPTSLYGDFDLILCCNLLFYYRADHLQRILDKLCRALAPDGYFVTGEAEREAVANHPGFRSVVLPAAAYLADPNAIKKVRK